MCIEYLRGTENVIADALSHLGPLAPESQDYTTSLKNVEKIPVHQLTQIAPASTVRLEELCEATTKDHQLQLLARTVHKGWPQLSKTAPTVCSHTGPSEMKLHMKMTFYTKEFD